MLTTEIMNHMWPKASAATRAAIVNSCEDVFAEYEVNTPLRVAHFMAQISHECGCGTITRENLSYRAKRIVEVFGDGKHSAKVTPAQAEKLAGDPQALAERVYGLGNPKKAKDLGNVRPGDAYRCRGGGMLQLTGGANYRHVGAITGFDLYNHPELFDDPASSFRVAAAEFKALNCLPAADADNVTLVTRRVNGPNSNGSAERAVLLRKWKEALPDIESPVQLPRGAETKTKPLMSSKIMQGATGTAVSVGTAAASKIAENANTTTQTVSLQDVADKVQQASDAVTTVTAIKDNAVAVVQVAKPFLGLASNTWAVLAICAIVVAGAFIAFTIWERHKKLRDEGV